MSLIVSGRRHDAEMAKAANDLASVRRQLEFVEDETDALQEQLGEARDTVRAHEQTIASLRAELARAQLGGNTIVLVRENARLRAALEQLEEQAADYRREIGGLEAKLAEPSSGRWSAR
jgi:predicted  nucleic acid-binding Zn-ribbon protein